MKALVFGCNGQLGQTLADYTPKNAEYVGFDLPELDISDGRAVLDICRDLEPDVVINAAAYTAVDKAESEQGLATTINVDGPRNIALTTLDTGAKLIHISTDFVFDGRQSTPYTPDAETSPLNVYGRTKRDGELAVLENTSGTATVIRTSWLYSKYGNNFVKTMLRLMEDRDELRVVADQFGSPTWCSSLARAVWAFAVAPEQCGVFHWSDSGETTWHEFAVAIQEEALSLGLLKKAIPVRAIKTSEYPAAASRPRYTVLDCASSHAAINVQPEPWRQNLRRMLRQMAE